MVVCEGAATDHMHSRAVPPGWVCWWVGCCMLCSSSTCGRLVVSSTVIEGFEFLAVVAFARSTPLSGFRIEVVVSCMHCAALCFVQHVGICRAQSISVHCYSHYNVWYTCRLCCSSIML